METLICPSVYLCVSVPRWPGDLSRVFPFLPPSARWDRLQFAATLISNLHVGMDAVSSVWSLRLSFTCQVLSLLNHLVKLVRPSPLHEQPPAQMDGQCTVMVCGMY